MSIKRIFIVISAVFAVSAVFADNSSVTSKKYVDDLMSGYQGKLPGSGANKLMIYDDETGIGEKSIETTLVSNATGVPTVSAVKTGLNGKQDTITGTAGYVMTGTGTPGEVGERAIYSANTNYTDALVTAETVNTAVTNAVNSSLIRVDANGNPSDNGTLWEINTSLFALTLLPAGYTQLEWIESTGTQYIDTGVGFNDCDKTELSLIFPTAPSNHTTIIGTSNASNYNIPFCYQNNNFYMKSVLGGSTSNIASYVKPTAGTLYNVTSVLKSGTQILTINGTSYTGTFTGTGTGLNYWLFGMNASGILNQGSSIKLYGAKLWNNTALVRNFVPAKNSSNVVGMYDLVSGQFFTNQGEGEFIAGPPVGN